MNSPHYPRRPGRHARRTLAAGLSAASVRRLRESWQEDCERWNKRDLTGERYVYLWADGVYFNVRLTGDRPCLLVLAGSLPDGTNELVAVHDGERESKISWLEVLHGLKSRGLTEAPALATGDGALGFWAALPEVYPSTKTQRCWVHKTTNVLEKMPKSVCACPTPPKPPSCAPPSPERALAPVLLVVLGAEDRSGRLPRRGRGPIHPAGRQGPRITGQLLAGFEDILPGQDALAIGTSEAGGVFIANRRHRGEASLTGHQ